MMKEAVHSAALHCILLISRKRYIHCNDLSHFVIKFLRDIDVIIGSYNRINCLKKPGKSIDRPGFLIQVPRQSEIFF